MPTHILQRLPFTSAPLAGLWNRLRNLFSRHATGRLSMQLGAGQDLRLHDAAGWTIACLAGSLWITQEADTRDTFLEAGDRFTLDRGGLALILARQGSTLAVQPPVRGREREIATTRLDAGPAPEGAQEVWLRAVYPECGPWNDPPAYRRSGLL